MRMIPPIIAASTPSTAERRLFQAIRDLQLPDDHCCLHSVSLPDHDYKICGELDFVIVGPRGLYVLEVKGGRISCDDGVWSFENRWGEVNRSSEGPFQQAQSGMFALRRRLLRQIPESELSQLVMGYGVAFPDCDFTEQSVEWPREIILDARRLRQDGLLAYLHGLETYWHRKVAGAPRRADRALVTRLVRTMRPSFDLVRSLQMQADDIEGRLVQLTDQQYAVLDAIEESDRILVQGGAGTGKTFLAIETARRHSGEGRRVLFLCFSPVLAAFLRDRTANAGVHVDSVHGLMLTVTGRYGDIPRGYSPAMLSTDPWFIQQLVPAFFAAAKSVPDSARYDVLVIDEAQDILTLEYLSALGCMVRGGLEHGRWRIFYDRFNQGALFRPMDPDAVAILGDCSPAHMQLKTNCRNTDQIVLQTKLVTGADLGTRSTGPGPEVHYAYFRDHREAVTLLGTQLTELSERQIEGRDITILSSLPFESSAAADLDLAWRQRLTVLDRPDGMRFPFAGLTFATVADFKGLENRFIILTDIKELNSTPAALATLYVGMSRARVGLWVDMDAGLRRSLEEVERLHLPLVLEELRHGH